MIVTLALCALATFGCKDIIRPSGEVWMDAHFKTCAQYEREGLCSNGKIVDNLLQYVGAQDYCCACGKGWLPFFVIFPVRSAPRKILLPAYCNAPNETTFQKP